MRIPVDDNGEETEFAIFAEIAPRYFHIVKHTLINKLPVIVHCLAGRQRSCAFVAAFLSWLTRISISDTVAFIQQRKPDAFFGSVNFLPALLKIEEHLDTSEKIEENSKLSK